MLAICLLLFRATDLYLSCGGHCLPTYARSGNASFNPHTTEVKKIKKMPFSRWRRQFSALCLTPIFSSKPKRLAAPSKELLLTWSYDRSNLVKSKFWTTKKYNRPSLRSLRSKILQKTSSTPFYTYRTTQSLSISQQRCLQSRQSKCEPLILGALCCILF